MGEDPQNKGPKLGGVDAAAQMLAGLDPPQRERLLAEIARKDPMLAVELQKRILTFDSLTRLEAADLQLLLREIPPEQLALALRGASSEVSEAIYKNLSARMGASIREMISESSPRRKSEVEEARAEILAKATRFFPS